MKISFHDANKRTPVLSMSLVCIKICRECSSSREKFQKKYLQLIVGGYDYFRSFGSTYTLEKRSEKRALHKLTEDIDVSIVPEHKRFLYHFLYSCCTDILNVKWTIETKQRFVGKRDRRRLKP